MHHASVRRHQRSPKADLGVRDRRCRWVVLLGLLVLMRAGFANHSQGTHGERMRKLQNESGVNTLILQSLLKWSVYSPLITIRCRQGKTGVLTFPSALELQISGTIP